MAEEDSIPNGQVETCGCFARPDQVLVLQKDLGMDGDFGEVSLLACPACGQHWLRYFYEVEAFTGSGRWYLGAVAADQATDITAANARALLGGLDWYFYGGSYYRGRSGRTKGRISLNP